MNSLNAVFGAWFGDRIFSQAFAPAARFAGRSKAQTHCPLLESSPLDHSYTSEIRASYRLLALTPELFNAFRK
jgi:hypothetical protein